MSCYVLIQELTARTFFKPSYCAAPTPPTVVAIDPGHGFQCAAKGMPAGTVGETDFPVTDPPSGRLQEDSLTMAMALEIERTLPGSRYRVVLTKRSAVSCPSFIDRGLIANRAKAKVFVSIHVNRPNPVPIDLCCAGTSAIYNPDRPEARPLADFGSASVAIALGVNNRGSGTDATLAVLKPNVTVMPAIVLETARLSGNDEKILHRSDASVRVATGLRSALDSYFSR
jgi:N-acetylmuramoyl-L-alanine amidase